MRRAARRAPCPARLRTHGLATSRGRLRTRPRACGRAAARRAVQGRRTSGSGDCTRGYRPIYEWSPAQGHMAGVCTPASWAATRTLPNIVLGIAVEYTSIRATRQTAASSCSTTSQARLRPPIRLEIFQDAEAHLAGAIWNTMPAGPARRSDGCRPTSSSGSGKKNNGEESA